MTFTEDAINRINDELRDAIKKERETMNLLELREKVINVDIESDYDLATADLTALCTEYELGAHSFDFEKIYNQFVYADMILEEIHNCEHLYDVENIISNIDDFTADLFYCDDVYGYQNIDADIVEHFQDAIIDRIDYLLKERD